MYIDAILVRFRELSGHILGKASYSFGRIFFLYYVFSLFSLFPILVLRAGLSF